MPRITHIKAAQQRYVMVPVTGEDGQPIRTETSRTTKHGTTVTQLRTVADKSKPLPPRNCDYCGNPIAIGTPYKWFAPKSGPYGGQKRFRHEHCPTWQHWEYSGSLAAQLARIDHEFRAALGSAESEDDVQQALAEAADAIREIAEAKREAAQNTEDGFGHATYQSGELNDLAGELDSWADEVENASIPAFPEPEETDCEECEGTAGAMGCKTCEGEGTYTPEEITEEQIDDWRSEVEDALTIVSEVPV